ncbi:hypothetical protein [Anoxybacillus gonensis]|nr:hypothetical protein [Anoxybacillus gonensis]EMI11038.1 hypothetical protein F510_0769 [Anoxybacillus gonensis]
MRKGGKLHFYKNLFSSIFDDDLGRAFVAEKIATVILHPISVAFFRFFA